MLVLIFPLFRDEVEHFFLIVEFTCVLSVVNIGATALVTEAATAIFGEAGVSAATGVMTVCLFSLPAFIHSWRFEVLF